MSSIIFPSSYTLKSNNNMTQQCSIFIGLVVSGVLDVQKLHAAHKELVELWPAVGGKLITSTTPYSFTTGTIVDFKARNLPRKVSEIGLVPYEKPSSTPLFYAVSGHTDKLFHYDTMSSNPPPSILFTLRVTVIENATLLGFRFAHQLFDGQASYDTLYAYTSLLAGHSIPQLIPPPDITALLSNSVKGEDNLPPSVYTHPHIDPRLNFTLGLRGFIKYVSVSLFHKLVLEEEVEQKMVYIPGPFIERLRAECQEELNRAVLNGQVEEGKELQITKNDVITAWIMKKAYVTHKPSEKQGVDIYFTFNYRRFLKPLPRNQTYLHNSYYVIRTSFPSLTEFQSLPLWRIAHEIRLTCVRNMQPSAVKFAVRFLEDTTKTLISPNPPDRPLGLYYGAYLTNVSGLEYHSLDFSPALVNERSGLDSDAKGKVVYTHAWVVLPFDVTVKPSVAVWKDGRGGYWARVCLLKSWWRGFAKYGIQCSSKL